MSPLWKLRMRVRAIDPRTGDYIFAAPSPRPRWSRASSASPWRATWRTPPWWARWRWARRSRLRRTKPLLAAVIFIVVLLGSDLVGPSVGDEIATPFLAVLFLYYSVGRYAEGRRFWAAAGILALGLMGLLIADSGGAGDFLYVLVLASMPALAGRAVRSRVLLQRELRVKALRLEADREELARRAVEDERGRIAEELQTVVANGLSAMIVQAGAVPRVLARGRHRRGRRRASS